MRTLRLLALSLLVLALVGTVPAGAAEPSQDDMREGIDASNAALAAGLAAGDATAIAGLYTADGWLMAPNAPTAKGHEAIATAFQGFIDMGATVLQLTTDELHGSGSMAHEVGHYVLEMADGTHVDHGKYIVIWQRTDDGWKLHRDMFNSDMAVPAQ